MIRARVVRTLLAGLIAASAVSVAQAYVVSGGTGSGTGATDTISAITLSAAEASDELYPGQTARVSLTATNTNAARVFISSLTLDTTQGTGGFGLASGGAGCPLSAFSFTTQNNGGGRLDGPPRTARWRSCCRTRSQPRPAPRAPARAPP